jgi:hypothetical protein
MHQELPNRMPPIKPAFVEQFELTWIFRFPHGSTLPTRRRSPGAAPPAAR